MQWLLVFGFGGLGAVLRLAADRALHSTPWPWSTFLVNMLGCFLVGVLCNLPSIRSSEPFKLALATGFCGGLTTFSALSLQAYSMMIEKSLFLALGYLTATVILGIGMVALGYVVAATL